MTTKSARLLLASVGSGVARCVLDTLDGRRDQLWLVGSDANPDAPALAECDEVVRLPRTDSPGFVEAVADLCRQQDIDLVIPGTDTDVAALAEAAADPQSPVRMASAPPALVAMSRDKYVSARWCHAHGIPFADSVATGQSDSQQQAADLAARWGFPLICKPRSGSASRGVTAVLDPRQLQVASRLPGMMLQPFLDPPADLHLDLSAGLPLFWEIPCLDEPALMAMIGPDGEFGPMLGFTATHRLGRNEDLALLDDPSLLEFGAHVVPRFREAGWRGPLNLQLRRSPNGWTIIEINPRFTGGTAGRLHLGLDEVRWIVNRWLGREVIPQWPHPTVERVARQLREVPIPVRAVAEM